MKYFINIELQIVTEQTILGECQVIYRRHDDGSVEKQSDIARCKDQDRVNKLSAFGFASEKLVQDLPILNGIDACTQTFADSVVQKVECKQDFLLKPFSKEESGAKTEVETELKLISTSTKLPPLMGKLI